MQLRRLDRPWEDFNHDLLVQAHLEARAIAAAEKERLEKEAQKAAKKGTCVFRQRPPFVRPNAWPVSLLLWRLDEAC